MSYDETFLQVTAAPDLAAALDDLDAALHRWVVWPGVEHRHAVTLWIAHCHFHAAFETSPRLAVLSPVKGSGKTRVLELIDASVVDAMSTMNTSVSALFRRIARGGTTVLIDEADTTLGARGRGASEKNDEIRGIVNAGYRAGAKVYRSEATGKKVVEREYPVFAAVALAGLGDLPDTITDRSIIIPMRRRLPTEKVDRYRVRDGRRVLGPIRDTLMFLALEHVDAVRDGDWPDLPDGIEDRAADVWEPLIIVADYAGGPWPDRARRAAVEVNAARQERAADLSEQLLADIRAIFIEHGVFQMSSADLLAALVKLAEAPWAELSGRGLTTRGLAQRLKRFGVASKNIRDGLGVVVKGYSTEDLYDAWGRYLPPLHPSDSATCATGATSATELASDVADAADATHVAHSHGRRGATFCAAPDCAMTADSTGYCWRHRL